MAEIRDGGGIKPIAFYLPQFHAIPENDRAWGEGFTEWTNIKKAQPLFEGHEQPRVPLGGNYYNLLDDETKIWQANLAKAHGVFGFCYYHYWFGHGRMLLQAPAEQMLKNPAVDLPFCFSWANEPWSKRWDGGQQEVIMAQDYGDERDWLAHLDYLLPFFRDARYITLDGKPVFLIYKPEEIPRLLEMIAFWQREIKKHGFPGLCLMIQNPVWFLRPDYNRKVLPIKCSSSRSLRWVRALSAFSAARRYTAFTIRLQSSVLPRFLIACTPRFAAAVTGRRAKRSRPALITTRSGRISLIRRLRRIVSNAPSPIGTIRPVKRPDTCTLALHRINSKPT